MTTNFNIKNCPICNNEKIDLIHKNDYFCLYECSKCHIVFKNIIQSSRSEIQSLQNTLYFKAENRERSLFFKKIAEERIKLLNHYANGKKILEIGCATGEFLETAKLNGYDVLGIDSSLEYYNYAKSKNLNVLYGRLDDHNIDSKRFDAIIMFHLLEHIEKPIIFLESLYKILNPNGILYIISPNHISYTNRIFKYNHSNYTQPDHLFFYSYLSIPTLLEKANFKPLNVLSKEYPHHIFTSTFFFIHEYLKKILFRKNTNVMPKSEKSIKKHMRFNFIRKIIIKLPYFLGFILYPIVRIYSANLEKKLKGHELIIIAQKN